jgi:hypothetical protein
MNVIQCTVGGRNAGMERFLHIYVFNNFSAVKYFGHSLVQSTSTYPLIIMQSTTSNIPSNTSNTSNLIIIVVAYLSSYAKCIWCVFELYNMAKKYDAKIILVTS